MAGRVLRELLGRVGYWLVGKGPAVAVGRECLATEEIADDKQVGQTAGTVGYTLAGMDHWVAVDKGLGEDNLGFVGSCHHASQAAWASHRLAGGMGH